MTKCFSSFHKVFLSLVLILASLSPAQAQWRNFFHFAKSDSYGSNIQGTHFGHGLEAIDEQGKRFRFEDFKGKISLVYFGFTLCPDVCPTTLVHLSQLKASLNPDEAEQLQVYLITVDPERDTPERLKEYLAYFDPSFKGLVGSPEQLAHMAKSFNVFYNKVPTSAGQYTMEHSAFVFVLDQNAESVLLFREGMSAEEMLSDIRKILAPK
ncbi:MAG: SCO family protein [Alcaligenaceae bacterium]|jgi:cytochrome oxidase Cu insertion factor (SCO1/SenC/PrrC family)|nr:SCO family protein [Alcaligenaceae bacterium]